MAGGPRAGDDRCKQHDQKTRHVERRCVSLAYLDTLVCPRLDTRVCPRLRHGPLTLDAELASGHRVSRPRGTGSVGDSVGEGRRARCDRCLQKRSSTECVLLLHGAWSMVHGAWCMVHGAWCMVASLAQAPMRACASVSNRLCLRALAYTIAY